MIVLPLVGSLRAYGGIFAVLPKVLVFTLNNRNICDRTGYLAPLFDPLVKDGQTGNMVRRESRDSKHPMEGFRPIISKHARGPLRAEPIGDETFITVDVTVDDL